MQRAFRVTVSLLAVGFLAALAGFCLLESDSPLAWIEARDIVRECDWKQIFS